MPPRAAPRPRLLAWVLLVVGLVGGGLGELEAGWFGRRGRASRAESRQEAATTTAEAMRVVQRNCLSCHNADRPKGGFSLTSRAALLAGGDSGKVVVPRQPGQSRLLELLSAEGDPHMPPKRQLTTNQVDTVRRWIAGGAAWDAAELARLSAPRSVVLEPMPPGYQPVQAVALDPGGRRLAFGRGGALVVQDLVATNQPVLGSLPEAHPDVVRALAWSADSRRIASGGFREVVVRDAATLEPVWSVRSNLLGRVTALRFSPHGGALVAADGSGGLGGGAKGGGWVRVFAADDGRLLSAWRAHDDTILDLAISADGGLLATAGGDKMIKLWELLTQREVARLEGHVGAVLGVAFHPRAAELVSVGADKQLKLWDVTTGEAIVTISGRPHGLNAVAWSADGSRVVTGDDEGRLHSFTDFKRHSGEQSSATATERQLGQWAEPLHAVAVSRDGQRVVAGGEDGVIHIVDGAGKPIATLSPAAGSEAVVDVVAVSSVSPPPVAIPVVAPDRAADAPSFVADVLPVLAKAGCSSGGCHAKADGQNGFKLSVFSYDPRADYAEIVKEARGRRVFPAAPDESLLLLKPTAELEHGGGLRLEPGSSEVALVRRWIRAGMPYQRPGEATLLGIDVEPREGTYRKTSTGALRVTARYSDGSLREVTALAEYLANDKETVQVDEHGRFRVGTVGGESVIVVRFMGFVAASRVTVPADRRLPEERYAALPVSNFIDDLAYVKFRELGVFPSDPCNDAEFLRRSSLDTLGVLPKEAEVREFLGLPATGAVVGADAGPTVDAVAQRARRAAWVERLLVRPEFADFWANKWADLLRSNPDRVGVKSVYVLDQWLRASFRADQPYDRFVRELLLAEGTNHRDGPVGIYRDRREPPELTTLFGQLFLGVRMECAKCHHHPNEKWTQDDFYQFAAIFGAVKQKGAGLSPPISAGTETFYSGTAGAVRHPVSGLVMTPKAPDGPEFVGEGTDPRQAFAEWLTSPGNPFFARAAVNRVWAACFGRGFVDPVDDFRVSNPASNEPLLAALAEDFAGHGYDLKHLLRTILNSQLYQLGSTPNESNLADTRNFSRSYRRRLPAEVLQDAVADLTGVEDVFSGCPPGTRAMQTWSYKIGSQFLDAFGRPNASSDCPCERDPRTSVVQALHLMNSRQLQEKLTREDGHVRKLAGSDLPPAALVTRLYLSALGRCPTPDELRAATEAFGPEPDAARRRTATEDVLWALLNSAEFIFNH